MPRLFRVIATSNTRLALSVIACNFSGSCCSIAHSGISNIVGWAGFGGKSSGMGSASFMWCFLVFIIITQNMKFANSKKVEKLMRGTCKKY